MIFPIKYVISMKYTPLVEISDVNDSELDFINFWLMFYNVSCMIAKTWNSLRLFREIVPARKYHMNSYIPMLHRDSCFFY